MKKLNIIGLALIILFAPLVSLAQNARDLLHDFRRVIGEPDSTGGAVTDAIAFSWLNLGLYEFSTYGVFKRETTYVLAAGRDSFQLPIDFLYPNFVRKTIAGRPHDYPLSDSTPGFWERIDTVVVSTVRPDTTLAGDVADIRYCYKKNAADKVIRPLIKVSPDSLEKVGRALVTRTLPPEFLSERIDTVISSTTTPLNLLRSDVFEVRAAFRKDKQTGRLLPIVRVTPDSLQKMAANPSDYFYFIGQPTPRIVLGQKSPFADSIFLEVVVASDFYTFIGQPTPSIRFGKIATSADSCFCQVAAVLPVYAVSDTAKIGNRSTNWLYLFPPPVRADTLKVGYCAQLDTMASATDSIAGLPNLQLAVRKALVDYMAAQFYLKKEKYEQYQAKETAWREIVNRYGLYRGQKVAFPAAR